MSRFLKEFKVYHHQEYHLAGGLSWRFVSVKSEPQPHPRGVNSTWGPKWVPIKITAQVELTMEQVLVRGGDYVCDGCGCEPPMPDEDGLRFLLENGENERLAFPKDEDVERERDVYPVPGWRRRPGGLFCADCFVELEAAQKATLERLKKKASR